ncbi:proteasome subunit alpha type-4-like [Schistocerca gregaria]|uniref:proteasome subunit alpha type-4-like n=1 Tax=Schistocerca gregaria TaxID=7010 RepID=UPI00211E02A2|nr:proteasome subunit alpha type-4-like [Schistocerca gregaria]
MSRRYDTRTTIFSPDGRLFQVEYAMEAITRAGMCVGILTSEGVVMAAQKRVVSKLLETKAESEKMYRVDNHVTCAVAGITSDANVMVNYARMTSQRYIYTYQEPCPIEHLVRTICDLKQGYTQFGGQRPFGVSFLYAGWDKGLGFQLYASDPSGNYGGWKAFSIGTGKQVAESIFKEDYTDDISLKNAKELAIKILSKAMDSANLTSEVIEFVTLTRDSEGNCINHIYTAKEVDDLIATISIES